MSAINLAGLVASADSPANYIMGWVGAVLALSVFAFFWQFVTSYEDSGDFPNKEEIMAVSCLEFG